MTALGVDPRIRARRVEVRRAEGRKRLRFLLVAVGLVALAVGAWGLSRSPLLDLDHVRIDGISGSQLAEVEAAVALEPGTPLFDLDLGAVTREIEALPWVGRADVRRDWPGTLRVVVEPRVALARVGSADGPWFLVDGEGVLIAETPEVSALPVISILPSAGLGEVDSGAFAGVGVAAAIPDDLLPWIASITIAPDPGADGRPVLGLDLVGSAVVELGTVELIDDKLAALRAILEGADLTCLAVIDVAVAELTTVTRDPVCEGQAT